MEAMVVSALKFRPHSLRNMVLRADQIILSAKVSGVAGI